jgi:hypothetical protein
MMLLLAVKLRLHRKMPSIRYERPSRFSMLPRRIRRMGSQMGEMLGSFTTDVTIERKDRTYEKRERKATVSQHAASGPTTEEAKQHFV